jgi:hypothetical protein
MSFLHGLKALLLAATLGSATLTQAADAKRHNPFQRSAAPVETSRSSSVGSTTKSYRFTHPRLRAVLNANDGSLANLDGHVLAQGESALGYTLVAVADHSARFEFRQHIITLQVTEDRP